MRTGLVGQSGILTDIQLNDGGITAPTLIHFWSPTVARSLLDLSTLRQLWGHYHPLGLRILGIHVPEYDVERSADYVEIERVRLGIHWPVVSDTDGTLAESFEHHAWPHNVLIDPSGTVIAQRFGAINHELETGLRELLSAPTSSHVLTATTARHICHPAVPELYVGHGRALHADSANPRFHALTLSGEWRIERESAQASGNGLGHRAHAHLPGGKRVHAVLGSPTPELVRITLNDAPVPPHLRGRDLHDNDDQTVTQVGAARTYELIVSPRPLPPFTLGLQPLHPSIALYSVGALTCHH